MSSPAPQFGVERIEHGADVTLLLRGEFDLAGIDAFSAAAADFSPGAVVTVDLRELSFIDSSGLRCLVTLDLRGREEGWSLRMVAPQAQVLRAFELSSLQERVRIVSEE